jgi:sugar transferase (PEP-CTERM/EpsH1 system associated)
MPKHILFLIPHLPYPPHAGGTLRNFGLIKGLAERGHHISLLTFRDSDQAQTQNTPLSRYCSLIIALPAPQRSIITRLRDLLAGYADMGRRFWSEEYARELGQLLDSHKFDVIHLDLEMAGYLPQINEKRDKARLIYDSLNAEYDLQWRIALRDLKIPTRFPMALYSLIQTDRLTKLETRLCRAVDAISACSEADANKLGELKHATPITVVPNAIDVGSYQAVPAEPTMVHPALVFTGKMDFRPNIDAVLWFADEILPLIRSEIPDAHLYVVGQKPHTRLERLRGRPDITLTGFVPDIKPYLAGADVYVAPLRMGSGTRFKLLEAMAMKRGVVSTSLGAEGLAVTSGKHLLLADNAQSFAKAVISLLNSPEQSKTMGAEAAKLVQDHYDWDAIIPRMETLFE